MMNIEEMLLIPIRSELETVKEVPGEEIKWPLHLVTFLTNIPSSTPAVEAERLCKEFLSVFPDYDKLVELAEAEIGTTYYCLKCMTVINEYMLYRAWTVTVECWGEPTGLEYPKAG